MCKNKIYLILEKVKKSYALRGLCWYFKTSWAPFFIFTLFTILLFIISITVFSQGRGVVQKYVLYMDILFYVYLIQIPISVMVIFLHIVRRQFNCACYVFLLLFPMCLFFVLLTSFWSIGLMFMDIDDFSVDLKIPTHIEIQEVEKIGFSLHEQYRTTSNTFQDHVLSALETGPNLEVTNLKIPSLEALLLTPGGRDSLYIYLAENPEWHFCNDFLKGDVAFRLFSVNAKPKKESDNFYSNHFSDTPFQYKLEISFPKTVGRENVSQYREGKNSKDEIVYIYQTVFPVAHAVILINEQSAIKGAKMTAKTIELLEKEFFHLSCNLPTIPQIKSPENRATFNLLREQGGIYRSEIWCNPTEAGVIYFKAFEITKNTPLSKKPLQEKSSVYSGYSKDPKQLFYNQVAFTIYEGDWEQFYAARFELWFKLQSGAPERLLLQKNYKIDGWMR